MQSAGELRFMSMSIFSVWILEGNLFLVKPDPNEFKLVTEFKNALGEVKIHAWTIPVVANGKLYLRYMQRLICYDIMPQ